MKKLLVLSLSALALVANLTSCKKGENDPFLSLHSRKARLAGDWTVTKKETTDVSHQTSFGMDYITTTSTSYDGTTETGTSSFVLTSGGSSTSNVVTPSTYTEVYTFVKDGTFTHTTTHSNGDKSAQTGTWMFLGKNKDAKLKNKEAITVSITSNSYTSGSTTTTSTSTGYDGTVYLIDELKNKEIVFIENTSYTDSDNIVNSSMTKSTLTAK